MKDPFRLFHFAARLGTILLCTATAVLLLSLVSLPCLISVNYGHLAPSESTHLIIYVERGDVLMVKVRASDSPIGLVAGDYEALKRISIRPDPLYTLKALLRGELKVVAFAKGELRRNIRFEEDFYVILVIINTQRDIISYSWDVKKITTILPKGKGWATSSSMYIIGGALMVPEAYFRFKRILRPQRARPSDRESICCPY